MKKTIPFIVFVLAILAVLFFWQKDTVWQNSNSADNSSELAEKNIMVKFEFDSENSAQLQYPYQEPAENVLVITQNIAQEQNWDFAFEDYGEMGKLVTQIGDYQNGDDQKYWQYFVDFEQPMVSADQFVPTAGQLIEWKFSKSEF